MAQTMPRDVGIVLPVVLVLAFCLAGCNKSNHSVGKHLQCRFENMAEDDVIASIVDRLQKRGFLPEDGSSFRRGNTSLRVKPMTHNYVQVDWTVKGRSDARVQEEYDNVVKLVQTIIREVEADDRSLENKVSETQETGEARMSVETNIVQNPDGRFCLTVMESSDESMEVFEELGLEGGGYTWEGIANVLIKTRLADKSKDFDIGAEADNMYVYSNNRASLEALEDLIVAIDSDEQRLREVLATAGDSIE